MGQRASTTALHLGRFIAALFASAQVILQLFSSASIVRLQVVVGLPLLLLPWGFQSRSCLVMLCWGRLRMCPIQCHLRFLMVLVIDDWPVLFHSSELLILFGHLICRICRRHLLMKTCRSFFLVCFQVSDLTLVSKILSLVFCLIFLFFHNGLRVTKACLAFPSLDLISLSAPPFLETILPRYVNWLTSSMDWLSSVMAELFWVFILKDLVLEVLISRPVDFAVV